MIPLGSRARVNFRGSAIHGAVVRVVSLADVDGIDRIGQLYACTRAEWALPIILREGQLEPLDTEPEQSLTQLLLL
jgi:hypothetical protein